MLNCSVQRGITPWVWKASLLLKHPHAVWVLPCPVPLPLPSGLHKTTCSDLPARDFSVGACGLPCAVPGRTQTAQLASQHAAAVSESNRDGISNLHASNEAQNTPCRRGACGCVRREGRAKESEATGLLQEVSGERDLTSSGQRDCHSPGAANATRRTALTRAGVQRMAKGRGVPAVGCQEWGPSTYSQWRICPPLVLTLPSWSPHQRALGWESWLSEGPPGAGRVRVGGRAVWKQRSSSGDKSHSWYRHRGRTNSSAPSPYSPGKGQLWRAMAQTRDLPPRQAAG